MWEIGTEKNWYAIFVVGGQEEKVKKNLEKTFENEMEFFVPKRELKERKEGKYHKVKRKLFPGYVLVRGNISVEHYYKMKQINGIIRLLKDEKEPTKIPEKELKILNLLMNNSKEEIGISSILKENDKIEVIDGPLFGLEGMILKVNARKGRAKVKINFLGEEKTVELGIEVVNKIQTKS